MGYYQELRSHKFLPNELSLDGVNALPTVWPDVSTIGINNMRRWPGVTSTTSERSMMSQTCEAISANVAIIAAAPGDQGAWMVFAGRTGGAALFH